ncbi:unnamed protein product [Meloidogyne enterolobii]|uniref:Uncharacterized protein n=1 Tax=Meloidogyne enterolobii TaxID=390850 RepID=A0ACB1A7E1_MELEN
MVAIRRAIWLRNVPYTYVSLRRIPFWLQGEVSLDKYLLYIVIMRIYCTWWDKISKFIFIKIIFLS